MEQHVIDGLCDGQVNMVFFCQMTSRLYGVDTFYNHFDFCQCFFQTLALSQQDT